MTKNDLDNEVPERLLPFLAKFAFADTRKKALAAGLTVLESDNGALYETFPDGRRQFVKVIEPPVSVVIGTRILLK